MAITVIVAAKRICMMGPLLYSLHGLKIRIAKIGTKRETRSRFGFSRASPQRMKELMTHPHTPIDFRNKSAGKIMPIIIAAKEMMGTEAQAY